MSHDKKCPKCLEVKAIGLFVRSGDSYKSWCKACCCTAARNRREAHPDYSGPRPVGRTPEAVARQRASEAARRLVDPEKYRGRDNAYRAKNKDATNANKRAWRAANPDKYAAHVARYRAKNPDKIKDIYRATAERRSQSVSYALSMRISRRIRSCLRGQKAESGAFAVVGYTLNALREHLERQFVRGMSWENRSLWHIDHIVPLAAFDITGTDCDEFKRAWALSNLRPLWAKENIAKKYRREFLL